MIKVMLTRLGLKKIDFYMGYNEYLIPHCKYQYTFDHTGQQEAWKEMVSIENFP